MTVLKNIYEVAKIITDFLMKSSITIILVISSLMVFGTLMPMKLVSVMVLYLLVRLVKSVKDNDFERESEAQEQEIYFR